MGVMLKEQLCKNVVEVRRVSDRVMAVVLAFEKDVLRFNLRVCSTKWEIFLRKHSFYDKLKGEWDMHSSGDLDMWLGDFNQDTGSIMMHLMGFIESMA